MRSKALSLRFEPPTLSPNRSKELLQMLQPFSARSRTAVIEMAEAAGLRLLSPPQFDIANATTYGVGELILQALKSGFKKIIVGLGGSATNDGGAGCAKALGVRFLDEHNKE